VSAGSLADLLAAAVRRLLRDSHALVGRASTVGHSVPDVAFGALPPRAKSVSTAARASPIGWTVRFGSGAERAMCGDEFVLIRSQLSRFGLCRQQTQGPSSVRRPDTAISWVAGGVDQVEPKAVLDRAAFL